ncbi:hypothetical protein P4O66_022716 [Electrophorus voltai]|uniref:Uncharacterized protein n=1 Tax=Electrophorus voltai TaxID=2609070 RepID=A0AAD8ZQ16_9TELE|nr:hypothetical protein P4O66_022716 [Electrophorus voltai]
MASLESAEVYIPRDACVRTIRLQDLPSSISRKIGNCLRASEHERQACRRSSPTATWICPVELRPEAGERPAAGRTLVPLEGQVCLPVVSASLLAHRLLQEALPYGNRSHSPAGPDGGAAPVSCSRVSAGRRNAMILYDGQIFLSVRKTKNQGRGTRHTIPHNAGAGRPQNDGWSKQEPACQVPGLESVQNEHHMEETDNGVQQDGLPSGSVYSNDAAVTERLVGDSRRSLSGLEADVMGGAERSCAVDAEGRVQMLPAEVPRDDAESCQAVHVGEVGGTDVHWDSCGPSSGDRPLRELHCRDTAGSAPQARAPPPVPGWQEHGGVGGAGHDHREKPYLTCLTLTPTADVSDSSVFDELEKMERISHLRASLRVKEAELNKVKTLK